jgi:hypothetical protein
MQRVTFGKFMEKTTTYERMPINIDPGLRRGVWLSWAITGILWVFYRFLPNGNYLRAAPFFRWTNGWLSNAWDFVADFRQILVVACALVFFMTLGLLIPTRFYQTAEINLHIALFIPVIFAAINVLFTAALLLPVIANLLVWICFAGTIVLLIGAVLFGVFLQMISH